MPFTDVYIGSLDQIEWDESKWSQRTWDGNVPVRRGPFFPPTMGGGRPWDRLIDMIEAHELDGKQVDWGAFAARATRAQIVAFMDRISGPGCAEWYEQAAPHFSHLVPDMHSLQDFVATLADDVTYALIAAETG